MKAKQLLKMWLLVCEKHGQMAHATMDGRPLLFASRRAVLRAAEESNNEGINAKPMRVEAFLRAGYSLEPDNEHVDPATPSSESK